MLCWHSKSQCQCPNNFSVIKILRRHVCIHFSKLSFHSFFFCTVVFKLGARFLNEIQPFHLTLLVSPHARTEVLNTKKHIYCVCTTAYSTCSKPKEKKKCNIQTMAVARKKATPNVSIVFGNILKEFRNNIYNIAKCQWL